MFAVVFVGLQALEVSGFLRSPFCSTILWLFVALWGYPVGFLLFGCSCAAFPRKLDLNKTMLTLRHLFHVLVHFSFESSLLFDRWFRFRIWLSSVWRCWICSRRFLTCRHHSIFLCWLSVKLVLSLCLFLRKFVSIDDNAAAFRYPYVYIHPTI